MSREIEVPCECNVTVGKLDPPRFQKFEKSGGLPMKAGCGNGSHLWFHVGLLEDGTPCVCGTVLYRTAEVRPPDTVNTHSKLPHISQEK